jgi:predicted RecA/RadA family phage recombinase
MKKLFSIAFALTTAIALGQASVAPKAAELLEKAKATHGGAAFDGLKTYQDTSDITYYNDKGAVAAKLSGVVKIDFVTERLRIDIFQAKNLVAIQQYDPKGSSAWNTQSGTIKLPKAEAEAVRSGLYQGVIALKFGKVRENATADGPGKMLEAQGEIVSLSTKGIKTSYLIDANGVVLAERMTSPQLGSIVNVYSDVREVAGLKLPFAAKVYAEQAKNLLVVESQSTEIKINPAFTATDFEMPKK